MRVLVVGGAGYIGAHVSDELLRAGYQVRIYDDFSNGLRSRITKFPDIIVGNVLDRNTLLRAMADVDAVIHLAAKKAVGESVSDPLKYYENNFGGTLNIVLTMQSVGVSKIVFSSTAAVYAPSEKQTITESDETIPISPYGATKLLSEQLIASVSSKSGISSASLRYFNVAGAGSDEMGDNSRDNLVPKVFAAISTRERPEIFGTDYSTPDGTCIRDYIHVSDLALAHLDVLRAVGENQINEIYNVGSGTGYSVSEVIEEMEKVVGKPLDAIRGARREGDSPKLIASIEKITMNLGWQPKHSLSDMISSSWSAWNADEK